MAQASVTVSGEVTTELALTAESLDKMVTEQINPKQMDGSQPVYKGVKLLDILNSAGVT